MKFRYSVTSPAQDEFDSMPRVPLTLEANRRRIKTNALVDSGAMISVMPFRLGQQLGMTWKQNEANVNLGGIADGAGGIPILVSAQIGEYTPVELVFAWTKRNDLPLILGQYDFFEHFQICFQRYNMEFEITPKPR